MLVYYIDTGLFWLVGNAFWMCLLGWFPALGLPGCVLCFCFTLRLRFLLIVLATDTIASIVCCLVLLLLCIVWCLCLLFGAFLIRSLFVCDVC